MYFHHLLVQFRSELVVTSPVLSRLRRLVTSQSILKLGRSVFRLALVETGNCDAVNVTNGNGESASRSELIIITSCKITNYLF